MSDHDAEPAQDHRPAAGDGASPRAVPATRRELGILLKQARVAAGLTQGGLARRIGYARSSVSSAESGTQGVPRSFWERCDAVLGTGMTLINSYDQLSRLLAVPRQRQAAASRTSAGGRPVAATVPEALALYQELGWQAEAEGG